MYHRLPERLQVAGYRLALEALDTLVLPRHSGSTLRGALGTSLRQVACRKAEPCADCAERETCAYGYVFETTVPANSAVLRNLRDVPRPFVVVPPRGPVRCEPGETITFDIKLIGHGMAFWPFFLEAFKRLGPRGLGTGRGRFRLARAWTVDPLGPWETLVYDGALDALRNETLIATAADIERAAESLPVEELVIDFVTPTHLKHAGEIVRQPAFHVLVRTILRRLSSLSYFHCGDRWETDYRRVIDAAKRVEIAAADTSWETWNRVSTRQGQRLPMRGILGRVVYAGPIGPFRALLVAGSVVHAGKGTVFGSGRYLIEGTRSRM
jgi:CRISPR-associated endoribonuclease Cas6